LFNSDQLTPIRTLIKTCADEQTLAFAGSDELLNLEKS
jgi:hypothetical protein